MGATVIAYLGELDTWWALALAECRCHGCQTPCRRHSHRWRAAWTSFFLRAEERLPVLRVYCPACGKTYTLLPDFLTPRHRYQTPVREAVVTGEEPAPPCSRQTVTRWRRAVAEAVPTAIQHLTNWLLTETYTLGRQDRRCLTGDLHGVTGLRHLRRRLEQAGRATGAACLFGWVRRACGVAL